MTVNIVIAHSDPDARGELSSPLRECGYEVAEAASLGEARAQDVLRRGAQDVLIEPISAADVIARVRTKTLQEELVGQSRRLETMLHEDPSPACSTAATCSRDSPG